MISPIRRALKSDWWIKYRADAWALVAIVIFFIAFFPQGLFGGQYLLAGDAFFYSYPMHTVAWRMLRHGQLPLWSPYTLSGYPLLSMAQLSLGYPLTWGFSVLPGYLAEQIYVLGPYLLAPIFTYFYLRRLGRSPLASLLASLSFGYGGMMASPLANGGMITNTALWLPLFLLAIERAKTRPFVPCLLLATFAYTMSVLSGFGQIFIFVGLLTVAYSIFISVTTRIADGKNLTYARWKPIMVACGAGLLTMGVAAWQIMETAAAVRQSVRSSLTYQVFTQGSVTAAQLWQSIVTPLFFGLDVDAYVPPLALGLAAWAVAISFHQRAKRDPRVFFWAAVAVVACLVMLGQHTPFYRMLFYIPLVNLFRIPSRHAFEWTFAIAVLSAFGWDALAEKFRSWRVAVAQSNSVRRNTAIVLLAAATVVGGIWWLKMQAYLLTSVTVGYLIFKIVFVMLTAAALASSALIISQPWRKTLVMFTVLVLCFIEPSAMVYRWWGNKGMPSSRFSTEGEATQYLKQFPAIENRVYTRVALTEQFEPQPRFDCANVSAVTGLQNIAGYEPLIFERYSRALGGVGPDSVLRFSAPSPDNSLLTTKSHVLDILNTSFVVSYSNLAFIPEPHVADGNIFTDMRLPGEVQPQKSASLSMAPTECDSVLLVTSLANSVLTTQGSTIAKVRIHTTKGIIEREIKAGVDTAEWAHDRPDVRAAIKHDLAPIFDSHQIEGAPSFPAYRYKTLLKLDTPQRVTEVEITNVTQSVPLAIYAASLVDSKTATDVSFGFRPGDNWQPIYQEHETLILRNTRARPRAWLVTEAEAVDSEEALRRIRGESATDFDPRRTALLEVRREDLPQLPGGLPAANSSARITLYEPNRLRIETDAPTASMLIVSEIFYPGWIATTDGKPVKILLADYLLRGVALPAGQHTIEMHYTAPGARRGAIIAGLTLLVIGALATYAWRTRATTRLVQNAA